MKKFLLFLLLALIAQNLSARKVFAELLGHQKGLFTNKVKVTVDFGQNVSFWRPGDMTIVDKDTGKDVVFNSMVDAMNFMGKCGWEFVQAYVITEGNQNVYHWLMTKDVESDDEIKAGFNVKSDLKASDKPQYTITFLKKRKKDTQWDLIKTETKRLSSDELVELCNEWRNQTNDMYDYDCQIKKE